MNRRAILFIVAGVAFFIVAGELWFQDEKTKGKKEKNYKQAIGKAFKK